MQQPVAHVWEFLMWFHVGDTLCSVTSLMVVLTPILIYDVLMGPSVSLEFFSRTKEGWEEGELLVLDALSWLGAGSSLSGPQE